MQRSFGQFIKQHFNGHIRFEVVMVGEVCNPLAGMVVTAQVRNKNQMGIKAESFIEVDGKVVPVLDIIIPKRSAGIHSDLDLDNINVGENINVEVVGKRYQLNDTRISIIGRAVNVRKSANRRTFDANGVDISTIETQIQRPDGIDDDEVYDSEDDSDTEASEPDDEPLPVDPIRVIGFPEEDLLGVLGDSDSNPDEDVDPEEGEGDGDEDEDPYEERDD
jgi:hypothetical protein